MTNSPRRFSKTATMASTPRYSAIDIARAKRDADIVGIIARTVVLQLCGEEFSGCCPFHAGENNTLRIDRKKGRYRCLRCGANGNAVKWLQETQQLSFVEAIEQLRCARKRVADAIARHSSPSLSGKGKNNG